MRLAAAVLAAGSSSRLDRPKQLLSIRYSTLVAEAVRCARAACDDVTVVLGSHADEVRALADAYRATHATVEPRYCDRLGVPAIFGRARFSQLVALSGDQGARALLAQDPSVFAVDWPDGAFDIDEPQHLSQLCERSST